MASSNHTNATLSELHLIGIPGLEVMHVWISIPFCFMYVVTLVGNCTLLWVIKREPSLHLPMYLFLSMLALVDLVMSTSITPNMLGIFWFHSTAISVGACLAQMYFVHAFSVMESGLLVAMAFDRYVAICHPLRYKVILTSPVIAAIGLVMLGRGLALMTPLTCILQGYSFCQDSAISHSYCEHMAVIKLACGDTAFGTTYSILVSTYVGGVDSLLIALSYGLILKAVLGLSSAEARHKTFSTCASHVCVIALFYIPGLLSMYMERYGQDIPPHVQVLMADLYLLIPPMFNPIIYGMKMKQIRDKVVQMCCRPWS